MSLEQRLVTIAEKATEQYSEMTALRALVQQIPHVGAPLDTLLGGTGAKIVARRQMAFLESLKHEMARLEEAKVDVAFLDSEEFLHLVMKALSHAARTQRMDRVHLLAHSLASASVTTWGSERSEDSEALLDLAAALLPEDVQVLKSMVESYRSVKTSSPKSPEQNELQDYMATGLEHLIHTASDRTLSRLQARGLIREIVGTYLGYGGGAYKPTSLGFDLIAFLEATA